MLRLEPATFADKTLDVLLEHLKQSALVEGLLLVGTTASGWNQYGDYDLVVVVQRMPPQLFGVTSFVDDVFTELLFYTTGEVRTLAGKKQVRHSHRMGWLVAWVREGRIVCDKGGLLQALKRTSQHMELTVDGAEKYNSWRKINYNFIQNRRYLQAGRQIYSDALDLRLLYSSFEVLTGYFTLRDLPWRGEKGAIRWLQENDPVFWAHLQQYIGESAREEKFRLYERLAEKALEPLGGLWDERGTSVMLHGEFDEKAVQEAFSYWKTLVS